MAPHVPALFDGVPAEQRDEVLGAMERRRFPSGAVVIAEGDLVRELLVVESGVADVFVADRRGSEHQVGRVGPGTSLGEMSLFADQPAAATVRAQTELEVLVLQAADFELVAARFPVLHRNLGAILSQRLARTNRLAIEDAPGRVTILRDLGAPPDLVWALACSVAWHAAGRTLLVVGEDSIRDSLPAAATARDRLQPGRAHVLVLESRSLTEEVVLSNEHILFHLREDSDGAPPAARTVQLSGRGDTPRGPADGIVLRGWCDAEATHGSVVDVPKLAPADLAALRAGALPAATPAGRVLGRVARGVAGLEVGVALGAGSIRGYAHLGALAALKRNGVPIDYLAGTSVGALVGAIHAIGLDTSAGADLLDTIGDAMVRPTLPRHSLLSSRAIRRVARVAAGDRRIEDLPIPLAIVAADIRAQREVVFRRGELWLALVTATSIPGIYPPVRIGPHVLVDGGVLNPVPTDVAAESGAGVVIGVNLGGTPQARVESEAVESSGPLPPVVTTILRAIEIMQATVRSESPQVPTVLVAPEFGQLPSGKLRNFREGRRFVEAGERAVEDALPRLESVLPWLRRRSI